MDGTAAQGQAAGECGLTVPPRPGSLWRKVRVPSFLSRFTECPLIALGVYSVYAGVVLGWARWVGTPLLQLPVPMAWTVDVFLIAGGAAVVAGALSRRWWAEAAGWWLMTAAWAGILIEPDVDDTFLLTLVVIGILRLARLHSRRAPLATARVVSIDEARHGDQ